MQNVYLNRDELLPIVKENKQKHDNIFSTAVSGYWVKAEEILNGKLNKVKAKQQVDNYLGLSYPEDHSDEYDRVIRMLELSSDDKIQLTSSEFDCYVRNQWNWRKAFLTVNSTYISDWNPISGASF
jgi:hypothetical protein